MTKPILDERFADWVDGRLKPGERALLEAEMVRDPALAQAAEDYRRTVQMLRGALAPPVLEGSIADRVLARIEPAAPARPRLSIRPIFASVIAAAALVLAFVIVRAIPPAPTVDVTQTAKREAAGGAEDFSASAQRQVDSAPEAAQPSREAAPVAPASEVHRVAVGGAAGGGDAGSNEAERRALSSVAEGLQRLQAVREEGASGEEGVLGVAKESGDVGTRPLEGAKRARRAPSPDALPEAKPGEKAGAKPAEEQTAVGVADDRSNDDDRSKDKAPPADSTAAVPPVFEEHAARWTQGLGELALVVEPGASDARASNPLAFFGQVLQVRGAPPSEYEAKSRAESSARPGAQLGFEVREVVGLSIGEADRPVADRRDALTADEQFFLGGQQRAQAVPTDRVFVVSGTAAAMRHFARELQVEVAAHDGKVLVERSQQLAKVLEAERVRALRVVTAQPNPAGPATPGPGTAGRGAPAPATGGPTTPGATAPGPAAPGAGGGAGDRAAALTPGPSSPERIELHVIVRARRPGGGR